MRERIEGLIVKLSEMREETLGFYLAELDKFTPNDGNPDSVMRVGILKDLDKHITNLELELKRMVAIERQVPAIEQVV